MMGLIYIKLNTVRTYLVKFMFFKNLTPRVSPITAVALVRLNMPTFVIQSFPQWWKEIFYSPCALCKNLYLFYDFSISRIFLVFKIIGIAVFGMTKTGIMYKT